jgi:hypothetical protein
VLLTGIGTDAEDTKLPDEGSIGAVATKLPDEGEVGAG